MVMVEVGGDCLGDDDDDYDDYDDDCDESCRLIFYRDLLKATEALEQTNGSSEG